MSLTAILNLWPPFGVADDTAITVDFRTALRANLMAAPGLEALGDRVFWSSARAAAFPHMRLFRIGGDRREANTADVGPFERTVQFTVLAADDIEAETIAAAALAAMEWDVEDPLLFAEGREIARYPDGLMGPDEQSGSGPAGDDIWMANFDVVFYMEKR